MFKTIEKNAEGIIIEKKSKFIANIFYIENEKEAEEIINNLKKEYPLAKHHCFAYRIQTEHGIIQKQSDDGEPSGTAGTPMLNVLEKMELTNVVAIVTRYFGGILLGTGGLVKAYTEALKLSIQNTEIITKTEGYVVELSLYYNQNSKVEYVLSKNNINIIMKTYEEKIIFIIEITEEKYEKIIKKELMINFQNITAKILDKKYIKI